MRLLVFLPDDPALKSSVESLLARYPRKTAKELIDAPPGPKESFVVLDPPTTPDALRKIDARALFVIPREDSAFREAIKPAYVYYHRERRCRVVQSPKAVAKAIRLESRQSSIIRWGAVLPMAAVVLAGAIALLLFRDALLRRSAIAGLQVLFGAKADVFGLASGFAPSVNLQDVAVANRREPMTNAFQFDKLSAGVELAPLFSGQVHVSDLTLEGLRFGSARAESGALPGAPEPEPETPVGDPGPGFEERLQELLKKLEPPALEDLETVRKAREIQEEAQKRLTQYEERLKRGQALLEEAKKTLDGLQKLEPPASVKAVQEQLKDLGSLRPESLDAARKSLEAAGLLNVEDEKKAVATAKADAEGAKEAVSKAQALVEKAKAVEKVGITDLLKVKGIIDDLKKTRKALEGSTAKLANDAKALEAAKQSIEKKQQESERRLNDANGLIEEVRKAADAGDLGKKYAAIAELVGKAKADIEAQQAELLPQLKKIQDDLKAAKEEAERFKTQVEQDLAWMKMQPGALAAAVERDKANLLQRYSLDQFGADELVRALFGEKAAEYLRFSLRTYETVRPYAARKKGAVVVQKSPRGTTFAFPVVEPKAPGFWIKKGSFTGVVPIDGRDCVMKGTISDVSSDPAAIGRDGRMEFSVDLESRKLSVLVVLSAKGGMSVHLNASGFPVKGRKIENRIAPAEISDGFLSAELRASFGEGGITASGRIDITGLAVKSGALDRRLVFLEEVYKGLTGLSAEVTLSWSAGRIREFHCRSDKGKEITESMRRALTGQIEDAKRIALTRFDGQIVGPRNSAQAILNDFTGRANPEALLRGGEGIDVQAGAIASQSAGLTKLVSGTTDPKAAIEELKKQLDGMTAQRSDLSTRNSAALTAQSGGVEAAMKLVGEQSALLSGITGELQAQVDRVTKLIK